MTSTDAKTYWRTLIRDNPKLALELAKECPRVAGKWVVAFTDEDGDNWERDLNDDRIEVGVCRGIWLIWVSTEYVNRGQEADNDAAKLACDNALRELGYLLEEE